MKILFAVAVLSSMTYATSLKNFRELNQSLSVVTQISPNQVKTVYNKVRSQLPQTGKLMEMSSSAQMALATLSSSYCQNLITRDKGLSPNMRWAHQMIDFTQGVNQFSSTVTDELFQRYAVLFWQRDIEANEKTILTGLLQDLKDLNSPLEETLILICSAFGTTPDFFTL